jgi:hypothetical protein
MAALNVFVTKHRARTTRLTSVAVFLTALAASYGGRCKVPDITITPNPPGGTVDEGFYSVKIPDGYGVDRNQNGIADIPNTAAYVQRSLNVRLDFTGSALFMPSVWPVPANGNAGIGNDDGPWRWTITPVDVPQDETTLSAPPSSYASAPGANNGGTLVTFTETPILNVDLFEGAWRIEFARMGAADPSASPIYWVYANVVIEDYLIVQLGDSYSAGEGSPERVERQGIWADDGTGPHPRTPNYPSCIQGQVNLTPAQVACFRQQAFGTSENLQHELGHRSSRSWGSQVAHKLEAWRTTSSVTFVNLAATGARLTHLTQEQGDLPKVIMPPGLDAALRAAGYPDMALPLVKATIAEAVGQPLPPQIAALQALIGPRRVDAVLMSFGGNDVGFSHAIAAYMIRDPDEDDYFPVIEGAIQSGDWTAVGNHTFEARNSGWDFPSNLPGLNGLPAAYITAASGLAAAGVPAQNVYIMEYPDPLVATTNSQKGAHADDEVDVCPGAILTAVPGATFLGITIHDPEIGRKEQRHARIQLIHPLNDRVAQAAQSHGWNLIGQVMESMYGHPICEPDRMVQRYQESFDDQGDDRGTLHPNPTGHEVISRLAAAHVHMPNEYREAAEYEDALMGPGHGYSVPKHRVFMIATTSGAVSPQQWLSVGFYPTAARAIIEASPALCNWNTLAIDAQAPHDYQIASNRRVIVEPWRIDNPVLRLFRREGPTGPATEVARLNGFGTLTYQPTDTDRQKEFILVASTPRNADTDPTRYARVHGGPTMADEYGTFEIRVRCPA